MTSAPESTVLLPHHIDHLTAEGFSDQHIDQMLCMGVRSLCVDEAMFMGFKIWDGQSWKSGAGIYFPFNNDFGQLRLDELLSREDGSAAKYLTPYKAEAQAHIPAGCRVITEGYKDALAGTLLGEVPTGAIAGVSHYRKALPKDAGYTIIFDSDGWHNPSVFLNLFYAGLYLKSKVNLLPLIPDQPKAGLCEFFKAGYTAKDYQELIKKAHSPKELLLQWADKWVGMPAKRLSHAIKVALNLAAQYLDRFEQDSLLNQIKKIAKASINSLRDFLENVKQKLSGSKHKKEATRGNGFGQSNAKKHVEWRYESVCAEIGLDFERCITSGTFEDYIYRSLFGASVDDWTVIDSAFYQYTGSTQWKYIDDAVVYKLIGDIARTTFRLRKSKEEGWVESYPYTTNSHIESAFKVARKMLIALDKPTNNSYLRAFKNVTVDMTSGEVLPHDKDNYLTTYIPHDYHPDRPCPEVFRDFIINAYGEDMLPYVRAYTAGFLDPTAPYGWFVELIGPSGSGKGTLLRFWGDMFGSSGYRSGASFADIATPEGRHQHLTGTSFYAIPDIGGYVTALKPFYEIVDNGAMSGRALYNAIAYQKRWNVRFAIACVNHLAIENSGDGWDRRCRLLPTLPRSTPIDPDLATKLAAVCADVISWALAMPKEERDAILLMPSSNNKRIIDLRNDAAIYGDSAKYFVDRCLRPTNQSGTVPDQLLHSWYVAFCKVHGLQPLSQPKLIAHLKTVLPNNRQNRQWSPMVNGHRSRVPAHWKNIAVLEGAFVDIAAQSNSSDARSTKREPEWICQKSRCIEGGLQDFEDFWNPPEDSPPSPPAPGGGGDSPNKSTPPPGGQGVERGGSSGSELFGTRSNSREKNSDPTCPPDQSLPLIHPDPVSFGHSLNQNDPWLHQDNLRSMANSLESCDYESLAEFRKIWPAIALNAAAKLLPHDLHQQIMAWVLKQNQEQKAAADSVASSSKPTTLNLASQILLCQSWVEFASLCARGDRAITKTAIEENPENQKQVVGLMVNHLQQAFDEERLEHELKLLWGFWADWDKSLHQMVFCTLRFTVQRINPDAPMVESATPHDLIITIAGCKLMRVPDPPSCTQWVFQMPDGSNAPISEGWFWVET